METEQNAHCSKLSFRVIIKAIIIAVTNRRKGLRRRWSIKRTAQNIQSIQVQGEHNDLADKCKAGLKDITHQLFTKSVKAIMGD
jgi:hypothetical protein